MDAQRERLVIDNIGLVKYIAGKRFAKLPKYIHCIDVDDLIGYGYLGLIDAASKFDSGMKVKFATYAYIRVNGAISDGLRNDHIVPRMEGLTHKQTITNKKAIVRTECIATEQLDDVVGQYKSVEDESEEGFLHSALHEAIDKLPPTERFIITYCDLKGIPQYEAAVILGLSYTWVSFLHVRALKKLRHLLSLYKDYVSP
jgi:RNA polymerase sigma factor FliA